MRRFFSAILACAVALSFATPSFAGALDLLKGDGSVSTLEDVDFETIIDHDSSGGLSTGDVFVGIFTFTAINGTNTVSHGASFSGFLVAEVTGISVGGRVTFGAVSSGDYDDIKDGSFTGLGGVALSNLPTRASVASALIVYDDSTFVSPDSNNAFFVNPDGAGTGFTGINDSFTSVTDGGPKVFEFGFTGSTYAEAQLKSGGTAFDFALALNETFNATNLSILTITSGQSGVTDLDGGALPTASFHSQGQTESTAFGVGDYEFRTDVNAFLRVVPEPTSMTLLALGGLTLLGAGYRRRKNAKVAA